MRIHFKMTKVQHLFIYLLHDRSRIVRIELKPYQKYVQITTFSDSYRLDLVNKVVDVDAFELSIPTLPKINEQTYPVHQKTVEMYTGNFLLEYDYLWVENERYRLETLWVNLALDLLHWYDENDNYDAAMKLCVTISEIAPLTETAYFHLMKINDKKKIDSGVH